VRLFICRHPSGALVCDLLLGSGRGTERLHRNGNGVIIIGEGLVVLHVIAGVKRAMMGAEDLLKGRRQMLQHMKSVSNLGCLWSPLPHASGRGFCAGTGHELDIGMGLEPRGTGFSRPLLEYVDGTPPCEIDDDRAVAMAFALGPLIEPADVRAGPWGKDRLRTRRSKGLRLTGNPWREKCRAPAAPPKASPV
jgi:hypothetical protein